MQLQDRQAPKKGPAQVRAHVCAWTTGAAAAVGFDYLYILQFHGTLRELGSLKVERRVAVKSTPTYSTNRLDHHFLTPQAPQAAPLLRGSKIVRDPKFEIPNDEECRPGRAIAANARSQEAGACAWPSCSCSSYCLFDR